MAATVRQHKMACTFKSNHIPFSPFSMSYLVSPPSEWSQSSGCWQADLFFSFKCYVLGDLDQQLFSLTSDEGGMAARRGNCSSHWDSCKNVRKTNTSVFTNVGIGARHCWEKNLLPCVKYVLLIMILFSFWGFFLIPKLAAFHLWPSAVVQLCRPYRADPCVECPEGMGAHSACDGCH